MFGLWNRIYYESIWVGIVKFGDFIRVMLRQIWLNFYYVETYIVSLKLMF